jgi:transcriptional regulator with XRE-family HTH domain
MHIVNFGKLLRSAQYRREIFGMFYDNYCVLCEMKKVTPTKAAKAVGLSAAAPTKWKKTGASPSAETLQKLAAYFGITVDELLGKEKQPTEGELHPANKKLMELSRTLSPEEAEKVYKAISLLLEK